MILSRCVGASDDFFYGKSRLDLAPSGQTVRDRSSRIAARPRPLFCREIWKTWSRCEKGTVKRSIPRRPFRSRRARCDAERRGRASTGRRGRARLARVDGAARGRRRFPERSRDAFRKLNGERVPSEASACRARRARARAFPRGTRRARAPRALPEEISGLTYAPPRAAPRPSFAELPRRRKRNAPRARRLRGRHGDARGCRRSRRWAQTSPRSTCGAAMVLVLARVARGGPRPGGRARGGAPSAPWRVRS